jgi:hypothetical protein
VGHTRPGPGRVGAPNHPQTPALTRPLPASSTPVFNVTHAHREIDHRVASFFVPPLA